MATPKETVLVVYKPNDLVWFITEDCGVKECQVRLVEADYQISPDGVTVTYTLRPRDGTEDLTSEYLVDSIDIDPNQSPVNPNGTNSPENGNIYETVDDALLAYRGDLTS